MSSALATLAEAGIHADRDGLHVMPPEMLQGAVAMQEECKEFLSKTKQFNDIVGDFIHVMESKSKVIEAEKLRAIGLGNRVDHEKEVRKRKQVRVCTVCMHAERAICVWVTERRMRRAGSRESRCRRGDAPPTSDPPLPTSHARNAHPLAPLLVLAAGAAGHDQREKGGA